MLSYSQDDGTSGLAMGQPAIDFSLWNTSVDNLNINISLNYTSSGIQVSNKGGDLGIGWDLNTGGVIFRELKDIPDEFYQYYTKTDQFGITTEKGQICGWLSGPQIKNSNGTITYLPTAMDHWQNLPSNISDLGNYIDGSYDYAVKGLGYYYDHEPDIFHFSFLGRSGTFIFEPSVTYPNGRFRTSQIPFQDLLIDFEIINENGYPAEITSFIITDEFGSKYTFNKTGYCRIKELGLKNRFLSDISFIDSWFLTKVETQYHNEVLFNYNEESNILLNSFGDMEEPYESPSEHIYFVRFLEYISNSAGSIFVNEVPVISSIVTSNFQIDFNYKEENRLDFTEAGEIGHALDNIKVFSKINNDKNLIKEIVFQTEYLKTHDVSGTGVNGSKLFLTSFHEMVNGVNLPSVIFGYNYSENENVLLPNLKTNATDYWGFYNGSTSEFGNNDPSPILYQTIVNGHKEIYIYPPQNISYSVIRRPELQGFSYVYGRDRRPNPALNSRGILTSVKDQNGKIKYYTWETNTFNLNGKVEYGPGLRIAKIESTDEENEYIRDISYIKEFTYNQSSDVNTTSGSILSLPKLHTRNYDVPETEYNHIEIENFNLNTEPSIVSYSKVTEYIGGKSIDANGNYFGLNGKIVHEFNNPGTIDLLPDEFGLFTSSPNYGILAYYDELYTNTDGLPTGPTLNYNWARGTLKKREVYDSNNKLKKQIVVSNQLFNKNTTPKYIHAMRINRMYLDYELTYLYNHYPIILEVSSLPETYSITDYFDTPVGINSSTQEITIGFDNKSRLNYEKIITPDGKNKEYKYTYADQYSLLTRVGDIIPPYLEAVNYMSSNHIRNYVIEKLEISDNCVVDGLISIPNLFNISGNEFVAVKETFLLAPSNPKSSTSFTYSSPTLSNISKDSDYVLDHNNYTYNNMASNIQYSLYEGTKVFKVKDLYQQDIVEGQNADLTNICFKTFENTEGSSSYIVNGIAHTGIQSTKAHGSTTDNCYTINLEAGKSYLIRYWTKQGNAGSAKASVSISGETNSVTEIEPKPDGSWTMAQKEFIASGSGSKTITIKLNTGSAIFFHYIDDLQVFPVGTKFSMRTYDPITGQTTSTIDSRGNTRKMEYDIYGKLNSIRDKDDYIIQEKRYNYKEAPINADISKLEFGFEGGTKEVVVDANLAFDILVTGDNFLTVTKLNSTAIRITCPNDPSATTKRALVYLYHTLYPEQKIAIEVIQVSGRYVGTSFEIPGTN
ncbi:MAG TPA: hypothetical protein DCQ26_19150 [Marinilabiliales bacterium]|nr:hypothetical protein [Marinilabiliales bacterium]HBY52880.1 hypothetical protein [Marinilabiliales bacterium]